MTRSIWRAAAGAAFGALAGAACLVAVSAAGPAIDFGTDRNLPPVATGFYPVERNGQQTYAWTSDRAELVLPGLDRHVPWRCSIRFRGARSETMPQPDLAVAVDGVSAVTRRGTNDYQDVEFTAPASDRGTGLTLTFAIAPTFVPGGRDPRVLGIQVERVGCSPAGGAIVWPPGRAMGAAAIAGAVFGAAFALSGLTIGWAFLATLLLTSAQAAPLVAGAAQFGPYTATLVRLAVWVGLLALAFFRLSDAVRRVPLSLPARIVVVFSASAVYLKLLGLLHPSKLVVDALFHAHRFAAVLAGRFYFTQLSTSATPFPYAIGLYLFAAPWSWLTHDYVSLLRIVVCASEVFVAALLYPMVVRAWNDRLSAVFAVVLANLVPLAYAIVGNANLTAAFGQTVALATMIAVTTYARRGGSIGYLAGIALLATLGFICHVGIVVLLLTALLAVACLYRWRGGAELRATARSVFAATLIAIALSIALYWGHFGPVYSGQIARARAVVSAALAPADSATTTAPPQATRRDTGPMLGRTYIPLRQRALDVYRQTVPNIGWPILALAVVGVWRLLAERAHDRLVLTLGAWGIMSIGFLALSVLTAVDRRYQQDAWEFIGRVELASAPALAVLAGRGAAWAWRAGLWLRLAAGATVAGAVALAFQAWRGWLP